MGVRQKYQRTRLGPGLAFAVIHAVRNASVARGIEQRRNVVDPREQCRHAQHHRDHRRTRFEALSNVRKESGCDESVTAEQTFTAVVLAGERPSPATDPLASAAGVASKVLVPIAGVCGHRARGRHHRTMPANQSTHAGWSQCIDAQRRTAARCPHRVGQLDLDRADREPRRQRERSARCDRHRRADPADDRRPRVHHAGNTRSVLHRGAEDRRRFCSRLRAPCRRDGDVSAHAPHRLALQRRHLLRLQPVRGAASRPVTRLRSSGATSKRSASGRGASCECSESACFYATSPNGYRLQTR